MASPCTTRNEYDDVQLERIASNKEPQSQSASMKDDIT